MLICCSEQLVPHLNICWRLGFVNSSYMWNDERVGKKWTAKNHKHIEMNGDDVMSISLSGPSEQRISQYIQMCFGLKWRAKEPRWDEMKVITTPYRIVRWSIFIAQKVNVKTGNTYRFVEKTGFSIFIFAFGTVTKSITEWMRWNTYEST